MKIIWNLTRVCTWNCLICCVSAVHINNSQKRIANDLIANHTIEMTLGEKKKIVNELYEFGVDSIDFSGGDILISYDNIELIKYAATIFGKENLSISIPGTRLRKKIIQELKECVSKFEFTLDSLDDESDGSRPHAYSLVAQKAIELCCFEGVDTSVSTILKRGNCTIKNIDQIHNYLLKNNVKEWEILPYYTVGRGSSIYGIIPSKECFEQVINHIEKLINTSKIHISFQHKIVNYKAKCVKCNAVSHSVGVLPDGTVNACAWALNCEGAPLSDEFNLGNLRDNSIKEILTSEKAREWVKRSDVCMVDKSKKYDKYNIGLMYY